MDPRASLIQLFYLINMAMALLLPSSVQPCKHCGNGSIQEKDMQSIRIELIKQRILEKLRMSSVPVMSKPRRPIPQKVLQDMMMYSDHDQYNNNVQDYGLDEFYAKENQMVVFAELGGGRCVTKGASHMACLSFTVPKVLFKNHNNIAMAQLNFHVKKDHPIKHLTLRDKYDEKEILPQVRLDNVKEGWLPVDIAINVRRWSRRETDIPFSIQISCEDCSPHELQHLVNFDGEYTPFLIIDPGTKPPHRKRRGAECTNGMTSCCRETLFINFTDIGWDSWIIEPKGYNANYCKGTCAANLQHQNFHHTTIIQSFQESLAKKDAKLVINDFGLSSCCAPTRMSTLNLLFYDGDGTVHRSVLPNMSVDTCGCS